MPFKWTKIEELDLPRYVFPEAQEVLGLKLNLLNHSLAGDGRLKVLRAVYDALRGARVQYALEMFSPSAVSQLIRSPDEVLLRQKQGTCLDLALLFCGLCLGHELLPVLVVLEGHAFVLVSLRHGLRDWDAYTREEFGSLFRKIKCADANPLRELVARGSYVAVECTGFAASGALAADTPEGAGRQEDGTLSFDRALAAGREHFDRLDRRPLAYALDIAVAHNLYGLTPRESRAPRPGADHVIHRGPCSADQLAYMLDRSEQELELGKALLHHREKKPRRPFVCVFHGDEYESHSKFLERLQVKSFPKLIKTINPAASEVVTPYTMQVKFGDSGAADEEKCWDYVRAAKFNSMPLKPERMTEIIGKRATHIMFNLSLFAQDFGGTKPEVLGRFFRFWEAWPDSREETLLVVCISIKYRHRPSARASLLSRLWPRDRDNRVRAYLRALNFDAFPRLHGVCLPELGAISESEALTLINDPLIKQLFGFTEADVRRIFAEEAVTGLIPMETLLDELEKLHHRVNPGGRR